MNQTSHEIKHFINGWAKVCDEIKSEAQIVKDFLKENFEETLLQHNN